MYYANINSKDILINISKCSIDSDEYGSDDVQNIEVSEEIYNNAKQYGYEYYIYSNGEIILNPNYDKIVLDKAKADKIALNDELRDIALLSGVTYQNVLFDSDTDQKVNLLATVNMMSDEDTITWYGMDNQGLLCTKADLMAIGGLITELHSFCWNMNAYIKEQINNAQTMAELDEIEISYDRGE